MDPKSRDYLINQHKDLWLIENNFTFRGMYIGGEQDGLYSNISFPETIIKGHGHLSDLFLSKKADIKMGDTPSVLFMLSPILCGIGNYDDPTSESWGGQFKKISAQYWTDLHGNIEQDCESVNIWREDFLNSWKDRLERAFS